MENKGILIVIDGTDGTGKETQAHLLIERLKKKGFEVRLADFPQYGNKSAELVEKYLNGEFGTVGETCPFMSSTFYTKDRVDAIPLIKRWLALGYIVVSNRYTSANFGHQGCKIRDPSEREAFFKWLLWYEYVFWGIPEPDMNVLLYSNPKLNQELVDKKGHRDYVGGEKRDIHEADKGHLSDAKKSFLHAAKLYDWVQIDCINHKFRKMKKREEINLEIWQEIKNLL